MIHLSVKPLKQNVPGISIENYRKKFQTDPINSLGVITFLKFTSYLKSQIRLQKIKILVLS